MVSKVFLKGNVFFFNTYLIFWIRQLDSTQFLWLFGSVANLPVSIQDNTLILTTKVLAFSVCIGFILLSHVIYFISSLCQVPKYLKKIAYVTIYTVTGPLNQQKFMKTHSEIILYSSF